MAAGDVVINAVSNRVIRGMRVVFGTVTLDGSNPTPVALAPYLGTIKGAIACLQTAAIPVDGLMGATVGVTGTTLNIYAWQNTSGTDPTPAASTVNDKDCSFIAWGLQ